MAANDNQISLRASIDFAVAGQAIRLDQPHRKHDCCYAEFIAHAGDGKHIVARKLISSMWKSRWTKPMKIARSQVAAVHVHMVREG